MHNLVILSTRNYDEILEKLSTGGDSWLFLGKKSEKWTQVVAVTKSDLVTVTELFTSAKNLSL